MDFNELRTYVSANLWVATERQGLDAFAEQSNGGSASAQHQKIDETEY